MYRCWGWGELVQFIDKMNDVQMLRVGWGDRAWWVIVSVFPHSPDKRYWACLGDLHPDTPKRSKTWVPLYKTQLHSSAILGTDSPRRVAPFIPRGRKYVWHFFSLLWLDHHMTLANDTPIPDSQSSVLQVIIQIIIIDTNSYILYWQIVCMWK